MSIKSFANGMVLGLIIGVLLAPDSGEETRKKIAKKASDLKDAATDKYNDIADAVADKYESVKGKANEILGKGEKTYAAAKDEATNMFE